MGFMLGRSFCNLYEVYVCIRFWILPCLCRSVPGTYGPFGENLELQGRSIAIVKG